MERKAMQTWGENVNLTKNPAGPSYIETTVLTTRRHPVVPILLSYQLRLQIVFRFQTVPPPSPVSLCHTNCSPFVRPSCDVSGLASEAASHYTMERSGANQSLKGLENYSANHFIYCYFSGGVYLS